MIAKLIVHAESRERAIEELRAKLGEYRLLGIHTNIPLIQKILLDAKFLNVEHYTRYLQTEFMAPQVDAELAASMAAILHYEIERAANRIAYGTLAGFSNVRV